MALSGRHLRFLLIEQGAIPVVFNFLLNGLIEWAVLRPAATVPLWGQGSVGIDLLATGFILPILTCGIVGLLVSNNVRSGKMPPLPLVQLPHSRWFLRPSWMRALFLGAMGVLFGAAPIVWALSIGGAQPLDVPSFVMFKAVWGAMVAVVVTPVAGWWALASASRARPA